MGKHKLQAAMLLLTVGAICASTAFDDNGGDRSRSSISISVSSLSFTAVAGGTAPATQSFTVTAPRRTNFSIDATGRTNRVTWLSITPTGNLTTNQTVTVSVAPGALSAGTYNGSIRVSANRNTTSIPVSLVLTSSPPPPTLTVSPTSLVFDATANGSAPATQALSVTATATTAFSATATGTSAGTTWLSVSPSGAGLSTNATLTVSASQGTLAAGTYTGSIALVASGVTTTVPVSLVVSSPSASGYKLTGWNDLGMHCFDGADYSIFGVLPPYNTIHAHLMDAAGNLVIAPAGYTVTYQAITDPLTNTLNTSSIAKTNFWQYAAALGFGSPAPDTGVKGYAMPGKANTPQSMTFSTTDNTWLAVAIPITPYADSATAPFPVNYYPMMRLTAKNTSGAVLATTDIVLPISDEMACATCHSSTSGYVAAEPAAGWANLPVLAKDMKVNILRKHDDRFKASTVFQNAALAFGYSTAGLEATYPTKPILCANCHGSNALSLPGFTGIPQLTTSVHSLHATVIDPATSQTLDAGTTRTSCYNCHPGAKTQCLRGAMANLKDSNGVNQIECQSCHGNMTAVSTVGRKGWLDEPACQSCHTGTAVTNSGQIVYTTVFAAGVARLAADQTFATNPNTPAAGLSMYRFSSGHGGLQCEGCHNSTHAEYTTGVVNDNVQSINLQGHVGMIAECSACHNPVPSTVTGGPHGLHPIGTTWVSQHQDVAGSGGAAQCQVCHGTDYRGTILSKTKSDRTLAGHSFPAGTIIGCYSCHNGPSGG